MSPSVFSACAASVPFAVACLLVPESGGKNCICMHVEGLNRHSKVQNTYIFEDKIARGNLFRSKSKLLIVPLVLIKFSVLR